MLRHHLLLLVVNVHAYVFAILVARSGRFSVVKGALHLKERSKYAVKVVENKSLGDEENLEALETEVCAAEWTSGSGLPGGCVPVTTLCQS